MAKLAISSIIDAIMQLDSNYEVTQIIDAIKLKQNYLQADARRQFVAGDRVQFTSRNGQLYKGTIDRIKQKYILVTVKGNSGFPMRYNVPATMLSKVA
jgi:hypothetical protein|tara:strand:+ start:2047 stop:2340 length:294 start_codon:yes stop_codon:yes gene_type:complete